jgi:YbgC/YbaW family acyl-CoA thioester hydrolase
MNWNKIEIEPRFYEIDSYSIVNNMYYLSWMEMARLKIAKDAGILVPRLYSEGILFVVAEARITYENAVNFWDKVRVETVIRRVHGSRMEFEHQVVSQITKIRMATATTAILCLKGGNVMPRMPEWIQTKLEAYLADVQDGGCE